MKDICKPIKIIITDDHNIVRDGIIALLDQYDEFEVIGEAGDGEALMELLKNKSPDIIILDIVLPNLSGIEITKIISEKYPDIKIIIFTGSTSENYVVKSIEAGAKGILPKTTIREELYDAIFSVSGGKEFISKYIPSSVFVNYIKNNNQNNTYYENISNKLTKRELQILKLMANGITNHDIAEKLFISVRTVEKHKSNIMEKLQIKTVVELVKLAIKSKIIEM